MFKRLCRLYPPYWLAIGACLILRLCAYGFVPTVPTGGFIKALFLLPDGAYLLNGEWTMVYDVIILYGLSSLFANKFLKRLYPFFVLIGGGIVVAQTAASGRLTGMDMDMTMPLMLTNVNTLGYVVGMLAYVSYQRLSKSVFTKAVGTVIPCILFSICMVLMVLRYEVIAANTIWQVLLYYAVVFVAVMSALYLPVSEKNLLVKIGDHSFGIYLFHFTVGGIVIHVLKGYLPMWPVGGIAACVSIVLGYAFDSVCTRFSKALSRNKASQRPVKGPSAVSG